MVEDINDQVRQFILSSVINNNLIYSLSEANKQLAKKSANLFRAVPDMELLRGFTDNASRRFWAATVYLKGQGHEIWFG